MNRISSKTLASLASGPEHDRFQFFRPFLDAADDGGVSLARFLELRHAGLDPVGRHAGQQAADGPGNVAGFSLRARITPARRGRGA